MTIWTKMLDLAAAGNVPDEFVAPYIKFLDFPLTCRWHDKTIIANWEASEKFHQDSGLVFGGYLSALADYLAGSAMLTVLADNETFCTKKLEIEYRKPIRTGGVTITATVIKQQDISATVEVIFTNEKDDVIAVATILQTVFSK